MGTRLSKAYMLTKVLTASKQEVVVYLYEGAISYLHRAQMALQNGQRGAFCQAIERVVSILIELSGSLNYTSGGHLALKLDAVYSYLIETLSLASSRADGEALNSCEGILTILYGAWQQAAASLQHQATPPADRQFQVSA